MLKLRIPIVLAFMADALNMGIPATMGATVRAAILNEPNIFQEHTNTLAASQQHYLTRSSLDFIPGSFFFLP